MPRTKALAGLTLTLFCTWLRAQAPDSKPNKLVSGKIVYVASMPTGLDRWIVEDLQDWGKYRVTANPEGVDLVMNANAPEKDTRYVLKKGVPQPKKERPGPQVVSISVTDWVTGQTLWQIDLVDRKPKSDEGESQPGPHMSLSVRGLVPDQIAQAVTRNLRQYVGQLEKTSPTNSR